MDGGDRKYILLVYAIVYLDLFKENQQGPQTDDTNLTCVDYLGVLCKYSNY